MKRIAEGVVDPDRDDGGMAYIAELSFDNDAELFVRIQSWSETKSHPTMDQLRGKRVRIELTVLED